MIPQSERRVTIPEDLWVSLNECVKQENKKISPVLSGVITPSDAVLAILAIELEEMGYYDAKKYCKENKS